MTHTFVHKGYTGSVEVSLEDACLHGRILFVTDLVTYEGDTVERLRKEFAAAVDRYLAHCKKIGKRPDAPCSGSFNVRIGPELHKRASAQAAGEGKSLNEFVMRAVESALVGEPQKVVHEHHLFIEGAPAIEHVTGTGQSGISWRRHVLSH